jgi:hypothetical protein
VKNSSRILAVLFSAFLSTYAYSAPQPKAKVPGSILIKRDEKGEIYVYKSSAVLKKIQKGHEDELDQLKFVKLADVASQVDIRNAHSATAELDNDHPRQSWYVYWGYPYYPYYGYYSYYPYYPINYYAYNYSYSYYNYYAYNYSGCNYYWYGYPHATPY